MVSENRRKLPLKPVVNKLGWQLALATQPLNVPLHQDLFLVLSRAVPTPELVAQAGTAAMPFQTHAA